MKAFADLYAALDETTKTSDKVAALARYFASGQRRPTRPGPSTSSPAASPGRPCRPEARGLGRRTGRRVRVAVRRELPRRRRPGRDHRPAPAAADAATDRPLRRLGREAPARRSARPDEERQKADVLGRLGVAGPGSGSSGTS